MINKLKLIMISVFSAGALLAPMMIPATVMAAPVSIDQNLCAGANLNVDGTCDQGSIDAAKSSVSDIMTNVINIFSLVVGVVSVIMIIVGGFKYVTSGGGSEKVTSAKSTIMYAVIGLVIVALAQIIVRFVLAKIAPSN